MAIDTDKKQGETGPNSQVMGEIVKYLKNYPFLLIAVAGLLILVGILIFDLEKLKEFKWLIYAVVLIPILLQFFLEFKKQGGGSEKARDTLQIHREAAAPVETGTAAQPNPTQLKVSRKAIISLALFVLFMLTYSGTSEQELMDYNLQIGLLVLLSLPAIILGFHAWVDIKRGKVKGKGWAIAAIILSVMMILAPLGWISKGGQNEQGQISGSSSRDSPLQNAAQITSICVTPEGNCQMQEETPVGTICQCSLPGGEKFTGQVRSDSSAPED